MASTFKKQKTIIINHTVFIVWYFNVNLNYNRIQSHQTTFKLYSTLYTDKTAVVKINQIHGDNIFSFE